MQIKFCVKWKIIFFVVLLNLVNFFLLTYKHKTENPTNPSAWAEKFKLDNHYELNRVVVLSFSLFSPVR